MKMSRERNGANRRSGSEWSEPKRGAQRRAPKKEEFVSKRNRVEKLGVKPGSDVLLLGIENDTAFVAELRGAGAKIRTSGPAPADMIFATFRHRDDLRRLAPLVPRMHDDGVLWTLRPKGSKDLTEAEMMRAGQGAGLVDVKVVSFSDVLTAEKFVVPLARRRGGGPPRG
jgi:hypothetical protein